MAVRSFIHTNHLSYVEEYFRHTGWTIEEPKGFYEVFRARRLDHKRPVIVYRKANSQHLTVMDYDWKIFLKFMNWYKRRREEDNAKCDG